MVHERYFRHVRLLLPVWSHLPVSACSPSEFLCQSPRAPHQLGRLTSAAAAPSCSAAPMTVVIDMPDDQATPSAAALQPSDGDSSTISRLFLKKTLTLRSTKFNTNPVCST